MHANQILDPIFHQVLDPCLNTPEGGVNKYYSTGAVIAVGMIGSLGYYIYQTKKGQATAGQGASTSEEVPNSRTMQNPSEPLPQSNKFEMD